MMYLGTKDGVVRLRWGRAGWQRDAAWLAGRDVWVVAGPPGDGETVYAGVYGDGLYRSRDAGTTWQPVGPDEALRYVRAIAFSPADAGALYVGTEPANVYRSADGGETWQNLGIRDLPGADGWSLPYSPRGGAVRTFALHPAEPDWVYAGVEQGGVLKSTDAGATWSITDAGVHPDVHALAVHPENPQVLFAATGGGVYRSRDGASTWERVIDGYTRGVAIHPIVPEIVFAGPARRVGHEGRILASEDGGDAWTLAARGLDVPMLNMVETFSMPSSFPNDVFLITSQGQLLHSRIDRIRWRSVTDDVPFVHSLHVVDKF